MIRPHAGMSNVDSAPDIALRPVHDAVTVAVPARLHLGFVDLNGGLGRRFGSLGIALSAPETRIVLRPADALAVRGVDASRAARYLRIVADHFGVDARLDLAIEAAIPNHVGLGSGTQLSLAVAAAVVRLFAIPADTRTLGHLLDRGARSSIGIGTFDRGGVVLDGGRGAMDAPPPIVSHMAFPEPWRILLILDRKRQGLHGAPERAAFRALPPFPADLAAHLCRLVLMVAMPALAEADVDRFGRAIAELQRHVGDHFAPAQGARFLSPEVAAVLEWLESAGVCGVGQTSWGPTGFAVIGSAADASRLLEAARARWPFSGGLDFAVVSGRNHGGIVTVEPTTPAD
jgi:beta-ribofuranosylaminobenzene 5'-phosphate synthase